MPRLSSMGGIYGPISGKARRMFNLATGGSIAEVPNYNGTIETWNVHTITANSNFTILRSIDAFSILAVAGGGAGGAQIDGNTRCGTGGGGGVILTSASINLGTYPVVVGLAGPGIYPTLANNGGNTTFNGLTAIGGGGGGRAANTGNYNGANGGSGGGGANDPGGSYGSGGTNTAGQGYAGGSGWNTTNTCNGGGGATSAGAQNYAGRARTVTITGSSLKVGAGGAGDGVNADTSTYGQGGYGGVGYQGIGQNGVLIVAYRIR